jgi:hypothetical protein
MGGSLSGCNPFLPTPGPGFGLESSSGTKDDLRDEGSASLGVSKAAMASARDSSVGLALIGVST